VPPGAAFGSNRVGLGGAGWFAGGGAAYRAGTTVTGPFTGTANATDAGSAATTVATTGVSMTVSAGGGGSSDSGCGCVGGGSSGGVKTTGMISTGSLTGLMTTLGGLRPISPTTRKRKQIELTHARIRLESAYSCGRQSRARSSDSEYSRVLSAMVESDIVNAEMG